MTYKTSPNSEETVTRLSVILLTKLQDNVNKDGLNDPLKSSQIENFLGINGVTVREIVSHLRESNWPICSGSKGYWYANTIEELEETIGHLRGRAFSMLTVSDHLKSCVREWRERNEAEQMGERRMVQSELC